jgi:DNA-binding response OmpR family regulator
LRAIIVDGGHWDELHLSRATRAAGLDVVWSHLAGAPAEGAAFGETWDLQLPGAPSASDDAVRALVLDAGYDLGGARSALRAIRAETYFDGVPVLLSVEPAQLGFADAASGFDDFVLQPCLALEVRARARAVQRRRDEQSANAPDADGLLVDEVAHEVQVDGRTVRLTAREFALFAYLRARRGRILSRQHLLARVWGHRYQGGPRTVDTHIGRLRLKFGAAFPIETVRTNGYRLQREAPAESTRPAALDGPADSGAHLPVNDGPFSAEAASA